MSEQLKGEAGPLKVVPLSPRLVNQDAVRRLEDVLADVKAGKVVGVAIAAAMADGSSQNQWSSSPHFQVLLASVLILQHRMLENRESHIVD